MRGLILSASKKKSYPRKDSSSISKNLKLPMAMENQSDSTKTEKCWRAERLLETFQTNIAEIYFHRLSGVELEADSSFADALFVIIR